MPRGLKRRKMIRIANAIQSFHPADIFQIPRFSAKPRKNPPSTAPGILPIPPIIEAIIPFRRALNPMVGSILVSKEMSIPATPAKAEPMANEVRIILSGFIPTTFAAMGSSDTALIALPSFVFWIKSQRNIIRMIEIAKIRIWISVITAPRKWCPSLMGPVLIVRICAP